MNFIFFHIFLFSSIISLSGYAADLGSSKDHWSFLPIKRSQLQIDFNKPIDSFLERKLNEKGVRPNAIAAPISLIKRVSIIITGLPPSPDRVTSFLSDYKKDPQSSYE